MELAAATAQVPMEVVAKGQVPMALAQAGMVVRRKTCTRDNGKSYTARIAPRLRESSTRMRDGFEADPKSGSQR